MNKKDTTVPGWLVWGIVIVALVAMVMMVSTVAIVYGRGFSGRIERGGLRLHHQRDDVTDSFSTADDEAVRRLDEGVE